jgi:hypothetical protein
VDRADEAAIQPSEESLAQTPGNPFFNAVLQFLASALGEGERDDRRRRNAIGKEVRDPLRDDFGLARSGTGDDLEMCSSMTHRLSGLTG